MQIVIMPVHLVSDDGTQRIDSAVRFPWLTTAEFDSMRTDFAALYGTGDDWVRLQLETAIGVIRYAPSEAYAFLDDRMGISYCQCLSFMNVSGSVAGYRYISEFCTPIRTNLYNNIMQFNVTYHREDTENDVYEDDRDILWYVPTGPITTKSILKNYYDDPHTYLRARDICAPFATYGHASGYPDTEEYYNTDVYIPYIVSDAPSIDLISADDIHLCQFVSHNSTAYFFTSYDRAFSPASGALHPRFSKTGFVELIRQTPDIQTFVAGDTTDPYDQGGNSGGGGGGGTFDNTSDYTPIPPLPTISVADSGMVTLFNPSQAQIRNLSNYLWSDAFDLDAVKKLFADPMDALIGLSIVPVAIPNGSVKTVRVAGVSTGIGMTTAGAQYVAVDCGSITVPETWGAYLDYDPYTKFDIYLPYIGVHALAADDIMGKTVHVVYHVDILTGACVAYIAVNGNVLYSFSGQCAIEIPITSASWSSAIGGAITIAGAIGKMAATGGASAPTDLMTIANAAVNQFKPSIEKSGAISGGAGIMGIQRPYLIKTQPRQALPAKQNTYTGYPSHITESLGTLTGFTIVDQIHLNGIPCTDTERDEILSLLKTGVIF